MTARLTDRPRRIAVLGGTGAEGRGLALRLAAAGHAVTIGSRDPSRAATAATELNAKLDRPRIGFADNAAAAEHAEIVILTVPYAAQQATVMPLAATLAGRILVDATVPLVPPKVARVQLPAGGSAVAALAAALGESVRVVAAFQNVAADQLANLDATVDCDVLVCGDDVAAREAVVALAHDIGLRGVHAGPICNAAAVEALTSVLISINLRYKVHGAGLRITGLPQR